MQTRTEQYDVGVIVGRFQVPELHSAHRDLIESVMAKHGKTIIVLGLSPLPITRQNPLDFEARKQMIFGEYPGVLVLYSKDQASDEVWSRKLDETIGDVIAPGQTAVLYGSRDSFIAHYSGRFPTQELLQESYISGTEVRKAIAAASTGASVDFRRGVVWASAGRYPTCFATVDVAILNEDETKVLLARKPHEDKFRFVGGFSDPKSPSYEADARREVEEETHIAITDPEYLASFVVDDWRYRGEADVIKTLFFRAKHFSGAPRADDDIAELRWFDLEEIKKSQVVETHQSLMAHLLKTNLLKTIHEEWTRS